MQLENLRALFDLAGICPDNVAINPYGGGHKLAKIEIEPYDFLILAEDDLERGGASAEINCITNAKRAILGQMDQALMSFGYASTRWNWPRKVEQLRELGFIAPRILGRVGRARNLLEHEYQRPSRGEIEDALDLAWLFVSAIQGRLHPFADEFAFENRDSPPEKVGFGPDVSFGLRTSDDGVCWHITGVTSGRVKRLEAEVWSGTPGFSLLVRVANACDTGLRLEETIREFLVEVFGHA